MSNFKRLLSAVLAVLMVLGMFSCLSTVVSAANPPAVKVAAKYNGFIHRGDNWDKTFTNYATEQNNTIRSYAELCQTYGNQPFVYYAIGVYEKTTADDPDALFEDGGFYWKDTNHIVQPGQELLLRFFYKTNQWMVSLDACSFYSRKFFDIDPGNASVVYDSSKVVAGFDDGLPNKGYKSVDSSPINHDGAGYIYTDDLTGTVTRYMTKDFAPSSSTQLKSTTNVKKYNFTQDLTTSWDYIRNYFSFLYGDGYEEDEEVGFQWSTDEPYSETIIKVRPADQALQGGGTTGSAHYIENGAVGQIGFDLNYTLAKNRTPGSNKTIITASEDEVLGDGKTVCVDQSELDLTQINVPNTTTYPYWNTEDSNHVFIIGDDSATPSTGNTVKFFDGATELTDLAISNTTSNAVDVSNVSTSKPGYTLVGWSTDGTAANIVTSVDASSGDVSLYAVWAVAVTFDVDGATTTTNVNVGANIPFPNDPVKQGAVFAGWYDSADATQTIVTPPVAATAAVTYVAKFVQEVTINFIDRNVNVGSQTGIPGTAITFPAEADLAPNPGYELSGWTPAETSISTAKDYTAVWTAKDYTITYDANGGSGNIANATVTYGDAIPANDGSGFTKTGHNFTGWAYTLDGVEYTGTTMPAGNLVATAQWSANTYTATFKVGDDTFTTVDAVYGEDIVMPELPSEAGYNFSAWAPQDGYKMDAEGKTYTTTKSPNYYNVTFTFSAPGESSYDLAGGGSMAYGSAVTFPAAPDVTGMTFTGWLRSTDNGFVPVNGTDTVPADNVVYTTVYEGNAYDVTLYLDGEPYGAPISVNYGAALSSALPEITAPEGYLWSGWKLANGDAAPATMPNNAISLYSTNDIQSYTLSFDSAGGTAVPSITQDYGTAVTAPAAPTKEGYTFIGWAPEFPATMPAADTTYVAQWSINEYTATFVPDNGGNNITVTANYGETLTAPEVAKEGYTFAGWDPAVPATMPAGDTSYTAQWTINSYNLIYMVKDTGDSFSRFGAVETVEYGTALTLKDKKAVEGWDYTDWALANGDAAPATMPAEDVTVYSTGTKHVYTNTYIVNGEPYTTRDVEFGATIEHPDLPTVSGFVNPYWFPRTTTQPAENITFEYRAAAGTSTYTFTVMTEKLDGSYDEVSETREAQTNSTVSATNTEKKKTGFTLDDESVTSTVVDNAGNGEIILIFNRNVYTITVNDAAGTNTITKKFEAPLDALVAAESQGQEFSKWTYKRTDNGASIAEYPATMPAYDFTATASYGASSFDLVPYVDYADGNGFTALDAIAYDFGATIAAVAQPAMTGYTFDGWYADEDCTTPYAFGGAMPANDVAIYGKFTVNTYALTFVNGVTNEPISSGDVAYGAEVTYPTAPVVEGYTFNAWSETIETMPAAEKTITAYYTRNNYTITYIVDGAETVKTYAYEADVAQPATPTKLGHSFSGWDITIPATMPAENLVATAQFTPNAYNATFIAIEANGTVYETVENVTFGTEFAAPATDPGRQNYDFLGWKLAGTSDAETVTFPYTMNAEGLTFVGVWQQDLDAVRVQSVVRLTTPYYQKGAAEYQVTINEPAFKLFITNGTTTWAFGKGSYYANPEGCGIKSITTDAETGNEIWVVELALAQKENGYKAYVTTDEYIEETPDQALVFSVTYDERTPEVVATQCHIDSVTTADGDVSKVVRGDIVTFTVTTSDDVTWLKFNNTYTQKDGTAKSLNTLFKSTTATDNSTITNNGNGTITWVVNLTVTYSCEDTRVDMDWVVYYKTGLTSKWIAANETDPVKMTVCFNEAAAVDTAEGYDKYTLVDVTLANATVTKGTRDTVTIVTTDDCTKVRITVDGKSTTFQTTTANNCSYSDANGLRTWQINYKFNPAAAGQYDVTVNARGTAWGDAIVRSVVVN